MPSDPGERTWNARRCNECGSGVIDNGEWTEPITHQLRCWKKAANVENLKLVEESRLLRAQAENARLCKSVAQEMEDKAYVTVRLRWAEIKRKEALEIVAHVAGLVCQDERGYSQVHLALIEAARAVIEKQETR